MEDASKKTFDVVVVYALDRWSRNLKVTLETLALLGRYDVAFVSITENIDYSNPMGRFVIKMLGSIAELYSDSMGGRIGESMQQRALNGKHTGGHNGFVSSTGEPRMWQEIHENFGRIVRAVTASYSIEAEREQARIAKIYKN